MLSPTELLGVVLYPLRNGVVIAAVAVFGLLLWIAGMAGLLGIWLLLIVVPALVRFHVILLEARSRGVDPQPPGIEFFTLVGNAWTLFPIVHVAIYAAGVYALGEAFGIAGVAAFSLAAALVAPASLIVLALTHSPLQSLHPHAISNLVQRLGFGYVVLPLYLAFAVVTGALMLQELPSLLQLFVNLLLGFSFMSLAGSVIAPLRLEREIEIPEPLEPPAEERAVRLSKERTNVLNHAYGFVSRDNRAGGLDHISSWIDRDPEPATAWPWFFEQMLAWERNDAALFFAQRYLKRLLRDGQQVAATKVIMRCRLVDERFKPLEEDIGDAIDAARACDNEELVSLLESYAKR